MLIADILHSCSDEAIAEAAVTSIGGSFAFEMLAEAARADQTLGALAASLVRGFASEATERDWRDLRAATRGSEVPLLSGLCVIVTTMMARRALGRADQGAAGSRGCRLAPRPTPAVVTSELPVHT